MTAPTSNVDPTFAHEVLEGLRSTPRTLPCKYFYDARGSELFERICDLDAYYPTRTELAIMRDRGEEIARSIGRGATLIEFGSGSGLKTRLLLDTLKEPLCYAPVEICKEALEASTALLGRQFPDLRIVPTHGDYTGAVSLDLPEGGRRVVYFPGSTIGNFGRDAARAFLGRIANLVGPTGGLLIGVDLKKDPARLHRAYNDPEGVTAQFNLNLLTRINRELAANIDVAGFRHYAFYNPVVGRIEMHLVCMEDQEVTIAGEKLRFRAGESIHTESSNKYTLAEFSELAEAAGLERRAVWTDEANLFSVQYFEVKTG